MQVREWDAVPFHQSGNELRRAINGLLGAVPFILTHFDSYGFPVSLALVVGMLALFALWHSLVDGRLVDGVMPG